MYELALVGLALGSLYLGAMLGSTLSVCVLGRVTGCLFCVSEVRPLSVHGLCCRWLSVPLWCPHDRARGGGFDIPPSLLRCPGRVAVVVVLAVSWRLPFFRYVSVPVAVRFEKWLRLCISRVVFCTFAVLFLPVWSDFTAL